MSWMIYFEPKEVDTLIRSVSGKGVKHGGNWRTLRVPDKRLP